MDRDSGKMDVHPWHQHSLERSTRKLKDVDLDLGRICQVCMCPLILQMKQEPITLYYRCKVRCDYYLHDECYWLIQDLKGKRQVQHPLHPQHHLTLHLDMPKFVCSFCGQTTESEFFFHCNSLSCDFSLHIACSTGFMHHPELLSNFHIQHFLHHPHDIHHRLSPYFLNYLNYDFDFRCEVCEETKDEFCFREDILLFKCITCGFYLHVQCSQIRQEILEQYSYHPQHPLTLLRYSRAATESNVDKLHCHACRKRIIKDTCVLHCTECSNFNLHIKCASLKPYTIPNCHDHPLVHFKEIYLDDGLCSACNTPCGKDSFRCMPCNYNIHPLCIPLPITVDDEAVHVHPLTLTPSFKEVDPSDYYCDVCETKRDPNHGIYLCDECRFLAHFRCALPKDHPLMLEGYFTQNLEDSSSTSRNKEDDTINEDVNRTIILQLRSEVTKLGEVVKQLIIKDEKAEQLTEIFKELQKIQENIKSIVRQLKTNNQKLANNQKQDMENEETCNIKPHIYRNLS